MVRRPPPQALSLISALAACVLAAASALAGPPFPPNCLCSLAVCPSGDLVTTITVRDAGGSPVPFSNVQIQLAGAPGLFGCAGGPAPGVVGQTNLSGIAEFNLVAAGAAPAGAMVFANGTPICANAPVAGPDLTANGLVDGSDMKLMRALLGSTDRRADFDGDGFVTAADTLVAAAHLGHGCTGSYSVAVLTPGSEFELILPLDGTPVLFNLAGGGAGNDTLAGEMVLTLGPRLNGTEVRVELSSLAMFGAGFVCPNGRTGNLQVMIGDDQGPVLGTWTSAGTFSLGPFRAMIHSPLADSMAAIQVADSVDSVPISGDSVMCTIGGSIAPVGGEYRVSWQMSLTSITHPGPYIEITDGYADQPPETHPADDVVCPPCKTLCIVPVILADDNGANPGIANADLQAQLAKAQEIWEKCCVIILTATSAVTINSTELNTWEAGETLGAHAKKVRNALARKQGNGQPLVDEKKLATCAVVSFVAHGNGPDGGGEAFQGGSDLAINTAHLKTKCPGPPPPTNPDPDSRVLAHELGHTLGLPQAHVAGGNLMGNCGPSDATTGSLAEGVEGALGGQCEAVYNSKGLVTNNDPETKKPKPCFKSKDRKCVIKLKCK